MDVEADDGGGGAELLGGGLGLGLEADEGLDRFDENAGKVMAEAEVLDELEGVDGGAGFRVFECRGEGSEVDGFGRDVGVEKSGEGGRVVGR